MLSKILASLAVILAASLPLGPTANAYSKFTLQNDSDSHVSMYIHSDDEENCMGDRKLKSLHMDLTQTFSCNNNLKERCLVRLYVKGMLACREDHQICDDRLIAVNHGSKLIFEQNKAGEYVCRFE